MASSACDWLAVRVEWRFGAPLTHDQSPVEIKTEHTEERSQTVHFCTRLRTLIFERSARAGCAKWVREKAPCPPPRVGALSFSFCLQLRILVPRKKQARGLSALIGPKSVLPLRPEALCSFQALSWQSARRKQQYLLSLDRRLGLWQGCCEHPKDVAQSHSSS